MTNLETEKSMNDSDMSKALWRYQVLYATFRCGHTFTQIELTAAWEAVKQFPYEVFLRACQQLTKTWGRNRARDSVWPPTPDDIADACRTVAQRMLSEQRAKEAFTAREINRALPEHRTDEQKEADARVTARQRELKAQGLNDVSSLLRATIERMEGQI